MKLYATPRNMRELAKRDGEVISARGVFSYCRKCGGEYSASAGDYWLQPDDVSLKCCGVNMLLMKKHITIVRP